MDTLLLTRNDVSGFLGIEECMNAVENAFCLHAEGRMQPPRLAGMHNVHGGFHIKAGMLEDEKSYFVAKVNANFPNNFIHYGIPTIQGVIIVCNAFNGQLLALMDSIEITIIRTGAATGIAAKYLAPSNATIATVCGCGNQGRISLKAIQRVRTLKKIFAFDIDPRQAGKFISEFGAEFEIIPVGLAELPIVLSESHIVITCTPSKQPFIHRDHIRPGTFIAAIGADNEEKQELFCDLLANSKIIVDIKEQCAAIGELHHAIKQGLMTISGVHAELGSVISGRTKGRESEDEIIIFDSTGTALQDVAAAVIVYEKALASGIGNKIDFSEQPGPGNPSGNNKNERDIKALQRWFPFK